MCIVFCQKDDAAFAGERVNVGGIRQASGANAALDYLAQILFVEGNFALGHLNHQGTIGVAAGYRGAEIRQAGGHHCSQVPSPINADLHRSSRGPKAISPSYLLFTLLLRVWAEYEREMRGAKKYSNGHVWYYRVRQGRQF